MCARPNLEIGPTEFTNDQGPTEFTNDQGENTEKWGEEVPVC